MKRMLRLCGALAAVLAFALSATAATDGVLPFIHANCASCHSATVASGGIDFSSFSDARTFGANRAVWDRVLAKLEAGEMPPPGAPKPPAADTATVTAWLKAEFARQDAAIKPEPGPVFARRLSRAEYNNTVRDLLGVDLRLADDFPQDQAAYGFDDIADALKVNSVLLEKYADAADRAVRTAIFGPEKLKPSATHYPFPVRLNHSRGTKEEIPDAAHYDLTGLSSMHASHVLHRFPVDATYSFRVVFNGHRPNQSMPAHAGVWVDGKMLQEFEVDATDLEGAGPRVARPGDGGRTPGLGFLPEGISRPPARLRRPGAFDASAGPAHQRARQADREGYRDASQARHQDQDRRHRDPHRQSLRIDRHRGPLRSGHRALAREPASHLRVRADGPTRAAAPSLPHLRSAGFAAP